MRRPLPANTSSGSCARRPLPVIGGSSANVRLRARPHVIVMKRESLCALSTAKDESSPDLRPRGATALTAGPL